MKKKSNKVNDEAGTFCLFSLACIVLFFNQLTTDSENSFVQQMATKLTMVYHDLNERD